MCDEELSLQSRERAWLSWKWVLGQAGERWTSANECVKSVCYFFFSSPLLLFHPTAGTKSLTGTGEDPESVTCTR